MRYRIYISDQKERDSIVPALVHNGYSVKQGKEKQGSKYIQFIEYWREGEPIAKSDAS